MEKEHLNKEINKIEFPRNEVFSAIDRGIKNGRIEKKRKSKSKYKLFGAVVSIAATSFLVAGFIFAPISYALSSIPLLGPIYEKVGLQIGYDLLKSDLITQLNQRATSNGVDVTITSAYYDGSIIGVTFNVQGDKVSLDTVGDEGPETGYSFELSNGKEQNQWSSAMTGLTETEDGYIASIEFYNPKLKLPESYTLPLTFTKITGVKGFWQFNVPVRKIPSKTIYSEAESNLEGQGYSIKMASTVRGKATTLLNYKTTLPLEGKQDEIRLTVFDSEGNRLSRSHSDILTTEVKGTTIVKDIRELLTSKISNDAKYITIEPEIVKWDNYNESSLNKSTPFILESKRFDYSIKVNSIKQKGKQLILDYNIQNTDTSSIREDIIQNFADSIQIIKSNNIQREENGELNIDKMLEYMSLSHQSKSLDDENLHFKSTFEIKNSEKFDYNDYSIIVPFKILSSNEKPIKMEPIIVKLN